VKRFIKNRYARVAIIIVMGLSVLYIAIVLLLKLYTRELIQQAIVYQTEGKVSVDIGKVKINLSPPRVDLLDTKLLFHDESGKKVIYDIHFTYLGLQVHSLWDFLVRKKIVVDFLVAENPKVEVSPEFREKKNKKGNESVHFEIGNIYLALNKITKSMQIKRFGILNGHLTLHKLSPNNTTINIGGVNITGKELAMLPVEATPAEEFQAGRIRINTGKQDIIFPEGNYRISYSALRLDTEEKVITIDGFQMNANTRGTDFGSFQAGFSRLKIFNMDFWAMYEKNLLKIDSVICQDPVLNLNLDITPKPNEKKLQSDLPLEKRLAGLTGKMQIGYLGFLNSNIDITTRDNGNFRSFNSKGNNVEAFNIDIDSARAKPIDIKQLSFAIKNYKSPSKDGMYNMLFDSVVYNDQSLSLLNFRLEPSEMNKRADKKYFSIANFELRQLSIADLITQKKLKAKELYLKNSVTVNNYIPSQSKSDRPPKPLKILLREMSDHIDLEQVVIENGYLVNQSATDKNKRLILGGLRSRISVNEMFDASTYELMGYSIGEVSFDSAVFLNGPVTALLYHGEVKGKEKRLTAEHLRIRNASSKAALTARNILIRNYHFDDEFRDITVDSIRYESATVTADQEKSLVKKEAKDGAGTLSVLLNHVYAGPTNFTYLSGDSIKAIVQLNRIEVSGLQLDADKKISLKKIAVDGNEISYSSPALSARTGSFSIRESSVSEINGLNVEYLTRSDTIKGNISKFQFTPEINKTLQLKYPVIGSVRIDDPVIFASVEKGVKTAKVQPKEQPADIGAVALRNGKIDLRQRSGSSSLRARLSNLNIDISNISKDLDNHALSIGKTSMSAGVFDVNVNDSTRVSMDQGQFSISLDHMVKGRGADSARFDMLLDELIAKQVNIHLLTKKGKSLTLNRIDMGGENLKLDSLDKNHILRKIKSNPSLFVSNINLSNVNSKTATYAYGIAYRNGGKMVTVDSFRFQPVIDRDSFNRTNTYQKDYMELRTKKIAIRNLDIEKIGIDSSFHIDYVEVSEPVFKDYKDKRLPFESGIIKPLPVDLLERIKFKFDIDSIRIYDGSITYEEFSDVTNSPATVHLGKVQVRLRNIKNHQIGPLDSLYLRATTSFLDTAFVGIRFNQSYTDTLSAFLLQIRVGRLSLPALNPVIGPMASAKVLRGYLDTLELKAIGREYLAHGKMKMLYKDLKVEFLNKNDQTRKTLVTKAISFAANLLVRRNNLKTTGSVFTERNRERSFINYWIKIVLSGSLTNAGIRSNSKQEKKYRKALKKDNVPEIPDVDL
jgi:hypothetical protein